MAEKVKLPLNLYTRAMTDYLIQVAKKLSKEFDCDIGQLAQAMDSTQVKKIISDQVHFDKYLCSPYRCKACKRNIPHDSHIFDNESIYE